MRISIVLSLVAACGANHATGRVQSKKEQTIVSPLPGFERADLVVFRRGDVVAYAVAGDKLVELGTYALKSGNAGGEWADREHLFVSAMGGRDVVMITRDAATRLTIPPPDRLDAPKPPKFDEGLEAGGEGELVVTRGAATWSRCAWGYPYDGFQCEVWVHAQLWPKAAIVDEKARLQPEVWTWPSESPSGFVANKGEHAVTCQAPGAAKVIIAGHDKDLIGDAVWTSTQPPQLLVTYGQLGLAELVVSSWTLHDGCDAKPIATGSAVEPGPNGFWLATGGDVDRRTIRRGARVLGDVEGGAVAFRPR